MAHNVDFRVPRASVGRLINEEVGLDNSKDLLPSSSSKVKRRLKLSPIPITEAV